MFIKTQYLPRKLACAASIACLLAACNLTAEPNVEVMHFWTSGGEATALNEVKSKVESMDVKWTDSPIAGGGGENAKTVMKSRILAGNPPTAMLMLGYNIQDWQQEGLLADLDALAKKDDWENTFTEAAINYTKVNGQWVGAPTNIHRINMVWASKSAFDQIGEQPPKTWQEFNQLADKFKKAGITPLAHGGQPWQDLTLFDNVALGLGGEEFYRKAFIDLDQETLSSDMMVSVFDQMRILRSMVDDDFSGRDWNLATSMVIENKAAMQIMGDWAKGEFVAAGSTANEDYLCFVSPGTGENFTYLINSLSMFEQKETDAIAGQQALAKAIIDKEVQRKFSIAKGSIPAIKGVSTEGFDACTLQSINDLEKATQANKLVPTVAYTHTAPPAVVGAITDVVTAHFNSDMSSKEAVEKLSASILSTL